MERRQIWVIEVLVSIFFATNKGLLTQRVSSGWTRIYGRDAFQTFELCQQPWYVISLARSGIISDFEYEVWPFVDPSSINTAIIGLVLGLLAVYEQYQRPSTLSVSPKGKENNTSASGKQNWLSIALPLGSLIFTLHNLLADCSTLVAWSWTGYRNGEPKGPVPHIHGSLTLVAQSIGLLLPVVFAVIESDAKLKPSTPATVNLLSHPLWFTYGAASVYVMYSYKNWTGYVGGLNTTLFLMSIIPSVLGRAAVSAQKRPAATWAGAMLVYCLLILASVFTVAYAFVPGGQYFRERTGR